MDPSSMEVKPHEVAWWTSAIAALATLVTRIFTVRQIRRKEQPAETKEQREKRLEDARHIAELEEQVLAGRFEKLRAEFLGLIAAERSRVDNLQHENGSQGERLTIAEKDINSLWRRQRGEKPE